MFVWTPELEAVTPPRRGDAPPVESRQMGRVRLFRAARIARAPGYEPRASLMQLMATGTGTLADEADAFLLATSAPRRGTGLGKLSGLSEVEAAKVAYAGVDRWVHLHGLARAVEIFSLVGAWKPLPLFVDQHARRLAAERLRQWLACADDASYRAARAFVEAHDGLPHGMRGWRAHDYDAGREAIAYLFTDERMLFARALDELAQHPEARTTLLLGAIATRDDHDRMAPQRGEADLDRHAVVIARVLRDDGCALLLAHAARHPGLLGIARALTAYVRPDAAAMLAQFREVRGARPLVDAYFAAHPALVTARP